MKFKKDLNNMKMKTYLLLNKWKPNNKKSSETQNNKSKK